MYVVLHYGIGFRGWDILRAISYFFYLFRLAQSLVALGGWALAGDWPPSGRGPPGVIWEEESDFMWE